MRTRYILLLSFLFSLTGCYNFDTPVPGGGIEGTVKDYTGLDGCGYIIELVNGEKLEPAVMTDTTFEFYDDQRVEVWYTKLNDVGSICMVGFPARIDSIREINCNALTDWSVNLPSDPFDADSVIIDGDCLQVKVAYGGGCEKHDFFLSIEPTMGPYNTLTLSHNAHGDLCEAFIHKTLSFDLTPLQSQGGHQTIFHLTLHFENAGFKKKIVYNY